MITRTFPGSFLELGAGLAASVGGLVNTVEPPFLAGPQTPAFRSRSAECEVSQEEGEANAVKISSDLGWEAEQSRDL